MNDQNPFVNRIPGLHGEPTYTFDVASRLARVREFNLEQLQQALAVPDLQKTVKTAIARRIRKLSRDSSKGSS